MITGLRRFLLSAMCATLACCALSACAASSAAAVPSTPTATTPAQGKAIFSGQVKIEGFIACQTCHPIDPLAPDGAGPNMAGIARRGAERVAGLTAPEYIRRSIRVHDEYVVPGFSPGIARAVVGREFGELLRDEQIDQLVAYLLTLDQPAAHATAASVAMSVATPASSATPAPTATPTPEPTRSAEPPTSTSPPPSETPAPVPTPTEPPAPTVAPPPTAEPPAAELPSVPSDPNLDRYAPCVSCHNQHPLQVQMPHPLNPACNQCHSGSPNRIGCPTCHSMHGIDNKHEATPDLPCATCHT